MAQLKQIKNSQNQQKGAALAVALVLMTVLTTLAVTLLYNTSLDTKMANAAVLKKSSLNAAIGGSDEFVDKAHQNDEIFGGVNPLTNNTDVDEVALGGSVIAEADSLTERPTTCPHFSRSDANDAYIQCNRFVIEVEHAYGKNGKGSTQIETAIASQIQVNN